MEHQEFIKKLSAAFLEYLDTINASPSQRSNLARDFFNEIAENLLVSDNKSDFIASENAVVEIIDRISGQLYRRYFELAYEENNNGVRLIGENLAGDPAQIVFLSESALQKMLELRGRGQDEPHCK